MSHYLLTNWGATGCFNNHTQKTWCVQWRERYYVNCAYHAVIEKHCISPRACAESLFLQVQLHTNGLQTIKTWTQDTQINRSVSLNPEHLMICSSISEWCHLGEEGAAICKQQNLAVGSHRLAPGIHHKCIVDRHTRNSVHPLLLWHGNTSSKDKYSSKITLW